MKMIMMGMFDHGDEDDYGDDDDADDDGDDVVDALSKNMMFCRRNGL